MFFGIGSGFIIIIIIALMFLWSAIKILPEYERGVVFFLGRYQAVKGPGLVLLRPGVQKLRQVSLRTVAMDVPPPEV
ncbi:MAG: slipin family protein, partial [Deltaproteobacteria bacterium]|nr:slipin family protein [Deltaproteobacteria bacterium]